MGTNVYEDVTLFVNERLNNNKEIILVTSSKEFNVTSCNSENDEFIVVQVDKDYQTLIYKDKIECIYAK
ncbi:hypothetical protein FH181_02670 [Staphylococcus warneri]|uniref:hypothetical protein n=1 Tax=Staphylococcus warneri TaxID=1292 RepID=UPI001F56518C|nr:hypothetical protein [Staphylococcus warneri]MCI2770668.1 hypothetical protein [Staphylococcus warneri]MCI2783387.1 hypothetical protein [Staphylococcus warneri]